MMNMPGVGADLHRGEVGSAPPGLGRASQLHGGPAAAADGVVRLAGGRARALSDAGSDHGQSRSPQARRAARGIEVADHHLQECAWSALPDHLDAHHFVHLYPPLFEVYLDLADSFKLPVRIPFPRQAAELDQHAAHHRAMCRRKRRNRSCKPINSMLAARAIKTTDHFVVTFFDKTVSVPFLMEILASLPQGSSELMTHPGPAG